MNEGIIVIRCWNFVTVNFEFGGIVDSVKWDYSFHSEMMKQLRKDGDEIIELEDGFVLM